MIEENNNLEILNQVSWSFSKFSRVPLKHGDSEKCTGRQFHQCVNIVEYTYTRQDGTAYCYKPVDHITWLNTVGDFSTVVSICVSKQF